MLQKDRSKDSEENWLKESGMGLEIEDLRHLFGPGKNGQGLNYYKGDGSLERI